MGPRIRVTVTRAGQFEAFSAAIADVLRGPETPFLCCGGTDGSNPPLSSRESPLFGELTKLVGSESAGTVQAMLRSASSIRSGIIATVVGAGTLTATATAVFSELQAALNLI